ncbi:MAG: OsmC family peroxiredoxin [Actinomycetota bacterium]
MEPYIAEIVWSRGDQKFLDNKYSRRHILRFDAGIDVPGSSSPLSIAAKRRFVVDHYSDSAIGVMGKNKQGKLAISVVTLRPDVRFSGDKVPTHNDIDEMHRRAHEECYIANSVKTEVRCEPKYDSI